MDRAIQTNKIWVHYCGERANREGEELKQLESTIKEEGLFSVEWCVVMSMCNVNLECIIVNDAAWLVQKLCTLLTVM